LRNAALRAPFLKTDFAGDSKEMKAVEQQQAST
jgi:hypothetical protein